MLTLKQLFLHLPPTKLCSVGRKVYTTLDVITVSSVPKTHIYILNTGMFQHDLERLLIYFLLLAFQYSPQLLIANRGAGHNGRPPGRTWMAASKAQRRGASGIQLPYRWGSLSPPPSHIEGRPRKSHRKLEACAGVARCRDNRDILSPPAWPVVWVFFLWWTMWMFPAQRRCCESSAK